MVIEILDQKWTVERVQSHDAHLVVDGDVCLGATWPVQQQIYISEELNSDRFIRTVRHELCHAYIAATQANNPETWDEEAICDLVGIYAEKIVEQAKKIYMELFNSSGIVIDNHSMTIRGHYVPRESSDVAGLNIEDMSTGGVERVEGCK